MTLLPVTNDRYATLRAKQHSSDFSMLVNSVLIGVGAIILVASAFRCIVGRKSVAFRSPRLRTHVAGPLPLDRKYRELQGEVA